MPAPARTAPARRRPVPAPRGAGRAATAEALATVTALDPGRTARRVPRPDLKVVREEQRRRAGARQRRMRAALVAGGVLAGVLLFAVAAFHAVLVSGQVRLDDLEAQVADAQARHASARLDVAELEAPERIVDEATSRLGMVTPPGVTYLAPSGAVAAPSEPAPGATAAGAGDGQAASSWQNVKPYLASNP